MRNNAALTASGIVKRYGKRLGARRLAGRDDDPPADIRTSTVETTSTSRADPAGGRRRLPPVAGNPRRAKGGKPCSQGLSGNPRSPLRRPT